MFNHRSVEEESFTLSAIMDVFDNLQRPQGPVDVGNFEGKHAFRAVAALGETHLDERRALRDAIESVRWREEQEEREEQREARKRPRS